MKSLLNFSWEPRNQPERNTSKSILQRVILQLIFWIVHQNLHICNSLQKVCSTAEICLIPYLLKQFCVIWVDVSWYWWLWHVWFHHDHLLELRTDYIRVCSSRKFAVSHSIPALSACCMLVVIDKPVVVPSGFGTDMTFGNKSSKLHNNERANRL